MIDKLISQRIGLGTWAYGGELWSHGWGPQAIELSLETIHESLQNGVRIIDTAAIYGLGKSEKIIGKALRDWKGPRPYIMTKCGQSLDAHGKFVTDLKEHSIRNGCHDSLKRLGIEKIDLMFLHYPSSCSEENLKAVSVLDKLKSEGKVLNIGLSNFPLKEIKNIRKNFEIHAVQNHYSLLNRQVEMNLLPYCAKTKLDFYAYQPLESGLLTGRFHRENSLKLPSSDWRNRSKEFMQNNIDHLSPLNLGLKTVALKYNTLIAVISLAWVLSNTSVSAALVGMRNTKQVDEILLANAIKLTAGDKIIIDNSLLDTAYPRY